MQGNAYHIIFDLDGTLIDSKDEVIETFRQVFKALPPETGIKAEELDFSASLRYSLAGFYRGDIEKQGRGAELFSAIYDYSDYERTALYKNVHSSLEYLRARKHHLYIATNKRYTPTVRILQKKNIAGFFSGIAAGEMPGKSLNSKEEMIAELKSSYKFSSGFMVGDSAQDVEAGARQNLKTIAVVYDNANFSKFAGLKPDYIIESFEKILDII